MDTFLLTGEGAPALLAPRPARANPCGIFLGRPSFGDSSYLSASRMIRVVSLAPDKYKEVIGSDSSVRIHSIIPCQ